MSITAYGSDAATRWAELEDVARRGFVPIESPDSDFWQHVEDADLLRQAVDRSCKAVVLDGAHVDFVSPDTLSFGFPDQGYRLNVGDIGLDENVVVVFARCDNSEGVEAPDGSLYANLPQPVGFIDPGAEMTAEQLITRIAAIYSDYSRNGDRPVYVSSEAKAERREAEREHARANGAVARYVKARQGEAVPRKDDCF